MEGRNDQPDIYVSCKGRKGQISQNFIQESLSLWLEIRDLRF
jgi:hypothetical protein